MTATNAIGLYEQACDTTRYLSIDVRIEDHLDLVKRIAQHMSVRMPASIQIDDLIQSGMIGLIEASKRYDVSKGASFETYAGIRIRGSIVDEIRKGDWIPRSVHRNARRISDTITKVERTLGRDPKDHEIADAMGIQLDDYYVMLRDAVSSRLFSTEEMLSDSKPNSFDNQFVSSFTTPDENIQYQSLTRSLTEAIKKLPDRERMVLALYYDEELNLKEIGHILGVTESRISQIHSQAALRLRSKLKGWVN